MAARKSTRKKSAAKKATKKKAARKKATRKKGAKKKASRKAAGSLGSRTRKAIDKSLRDLERELPKDLKSVLHDIRKGVTELENQVEEAWAEGEKRFHSLEKEIRKDSETMLKRFGLGPAKKKAARKKKKAAKKKGARKKATKKKAAKKRARR